MRSSHNPPSPRHKRGSRRGNPSRLSLARPYWMRRRIPLPGYQGLSCMATLSQRGDGQAGGNTVGPLVSPCAGPRKGLALESREVPRG